MKINLKQGDLIGYQSLLQNDFYFKAIVVWKNHKYIDLFFIKKCDRLSNVFKSVETFNLNSLLDWFEVGDAKILK